MKKILLPALCALLAAVLFVGCNNTADPVDTTDPSDVTTDAPVTTEKEKETKAPETEPPETGPVEPGAEFDLIVSDPIIVYQAKEGVQGWGRHQFPNVGYTPDGLIRVSWTDGEDKIGAQNNQFYRRISLNGGKTWIPGTTLDNVPRYVPMSNGKYLTGFVATETKIWSMEGYTSIVDYADGKKMYLVDDFKDDPAMQELTHFAIEEYDPATDTRTVVPATLEWPWATVLRQPDGYIMSISAQVSQHMRPLCAAEDGTLYSVFYGRGLDISASTLEEAKSIRPDADCTYLIASTDCGRTWKIVKQFIPTAEVEAMSVDVEGYSSYFEGLNEPAFKQLSSGRFIMLMRTGHSRTMMYSFSEDAVNWSDPMPFDECGVLPQLLTLDCGVTIATYGRPFLRVRATSDPTGENWQDPVTIELAGGTKPDGQQGRTRSCFYTGMIQLDANTALMVHTDFKYPNKNGIGVRTVMVRRIHIVPKTAAAAAE